MTLDPEEPSLDRRVRRTRTAIIAAFNRLILERGYGALTPGEVAAAANVGRSTFYEHFRGVDDVLAQTLGAMLAPLARACLEPEPPQTARVVLEHVWENRRLAQALFSSDAHALVLQSLASQLEATLKAAVGAQGSRPILALPLIAHHLAGGQVALMRAWISGRYGHSAAEIAAAMHASVRAAALALMQPQRC